MITDNDYRISGISVSGPLSSRVGHYGSAPIVWSLTAGVDDMSANLVLYSQNSKSQPYLAEDYEEVSQLIPQWGFFDGTGAHVERVALEWSYDIMSGPVYSASVYTASAYYKDDYPATPSLIATLEVNDYTNSLIMASSVYSVSCTIPNSLRVTIDGLHDFDSTNWAGIKYPFYVNWRGTQYTDNNPHGLSADPNIFCLPIPYPSSGPLTVYVNEVETSAFAYSTPIVMSAYNPQTGLGGTYRGWIQVNSPISSTFLNFEYRIEPEAPLIGFSNVFKILDFVPPYLVRRFNESWDSREQIRNYALAEHTHDNEILFDEFIGLSVAGVSANDSGENRTYSDLNQTNQELGRTNFERVANFTKNHIDLDVSNLNQLYSISEEIDIPIDDYRLNYPPEIMRLMDMSSVTRKKLVGEGCKCNENFDTDQYGRCFRCNHIHDRNRSNSYVSPFSYTVTADVPFVVENRYTSVNRFMKLVATSSENPALALGPALLSTLSRVGWMVSSEYYRYLVYDYLPTPCDVQMEGLINWSDEYVSALPNAGSVSSFEYEEWYGQKGTMEEMFNYEIHRGLYQNE